MSTNNGWKTAIRRNQETQEVELDPHCHPSTGGEGLGEGAALSQRSDRTDSEGMDEGFCLNSTAGENLSDTSPTSLDGGIVRELQETQTEYLSYLQAHHTRLEKRIEENEDKQRRLCEKMKRLEAERVEVQKRQKSALDESENIHQSS